MPAGKRETRREKRQEKSRHAAGFSSSHSHQLALRVLTLTVRILLLLAGLLPATLLLLTRLLARVLVLLARVRILIRHRNLLVGRRRSQLRTVHLVAGTAGSAAIIAWRRLAANAAAEPVLPTAYVQAAPKRRVQLPHRVPAVRK